MDTGKLIRVAIFIAVLFFVAKAMQGGKKGDDTKHVIHMPEVAREADKSMLAYRKNMSQADEAIAKMIEDGSITTAKQYAEASRKLTAQARDDAFYHKSQLDDLEAEIFPAELKKPEDKERAWNFVKSRSAGFGGGK